MSRADFTEEQLKIAVTAFAEAMIDLEKAEADDSPEHEFSEHFYSRMRENIELARKSDAAKRRKAARRKFWRSAAAVIAAIIIAFGALMVFSPEARAAVLNWTIEIYDKIVHYQFKHVEDDHAFIICTPQGLPEGFERTEKYRGDYYSRNVYRNAETGEYIKFEYFKPTEKQKEKIEKTGYNAEIYYVFDYYEMYYTESARKRKVCWYDPDRNLAFYAEGNLEKETFINTFTAIDFRLPRYEATWVPDGYIKGEMEDLFIKYNTDYYDEDGAANLFLFYSDMSEADLIWIGKGTGENTDDVFSESILINGFPATYYPPTENDVGSELVWIDNNNNLVFIVSGFLSHDDMIRFAESITCTESEW